MFQAFFFLPFLGLCLATPLELKPLSDEEIFYINSVQSSWKAGRNFGPEELARLKGLLGVDMEAERFNIKKLGISTSDAPVRDDLPREFDPRKKWPQCKSLNEIRDQSACADDWAATTSAAITDRICIHNQKNVHISAEDLNSCCGEVCGNGCHGGFTSSSWEYYAVQGIVSGGNYNSSEGCMPFTLPNCDHHVHGKYEPCEGPLPTPTCTWSCRKGYPKTYKEDKNHGQLPKRIAGVEQIMQELVDNGPVTASLAVYSDFFSYKSGVYRHTTGQYYGDHAVKILGYGEDQGDKYWLVANTWNEDWGDKGFFKIYRGVDMCKIEDQIMAGMPKA